jgi:hypothetical protein
VQYGIDLPTGAHYEQLPQGLRDYIRSALPLLALAPASNPALGIDMPQGADAAALPASLSDELHDRRGVGMHPANSTAAASTVLGIDLPAGAVRSQLPAGLTDYLRPVAAGTPSINAPLGVDAPAGAIVQAEGDS